MYVRGYLQGSESGRVVTIAIDGCHHFDSISISIITWCLNTTTPQNKRDKQGSSFSVDMACQAYNSLFFLLFWIYEFIPQSLFADLRFVSIYLWQNKRIGENDPSLMRHIYERFVFENWRTTKLCEKRERTSEQCHEFVKKNQNRPILRGKIVLMILFIRSHFVIDCSCTTIKLHISRRKP